MNSEQKDKLQNIIAFVLIIFFVIFSIFTVYRQNEKIKKLSSIELPYYMLDNASNEQHRYFEYAGLIISSYTYTNAFYGFQLVDSQISFEIYCKINSSECKIEYIDKKCMQEKNPPNEEGFTDLSLNQTGCVTIYSTKGKTEKRIY